MAETGVGDGLIAQIVKLGAHELEAFQDQLQSVYAEAFAEPPYNRREGDVLAFERQLLRHATYPDFRCLAALSEDDGRVLGFAYGYTGVPGQWWHDQISARMDPELAREWLPDHFELVELAVSPHAQGGGIGGRLHDALLAGLPHPTACLSTSQLETTALRMYRKRGWVVLLDNFYFSSGGLPYLIMGKRLRPAGRSSQSASI
ncbi:MAG: GNAT family N-acetyltransferase [Chloroflexota bacterium]|nr:GNAT family N-acetyltransferase [Chloroflexota bacterium]